MKQQLKKELEQLKRELFKGTVLRIERPEDAQKWTRFDEILKLLYS